MYEFFADLQLVLAICLDHDVRSSFVFLAAFLHQVCDEINVFVALKERSVVIVLDTVPVLR